MKLFRKRTQLESIPNVRVTHLDVNGRVSNSLGRDKRKSMRLKSMGTTFNPDEIVNSSESNFSTPSVKHIRG